MKPGRVYNLELTQYVFNNKYLYQNVQARGVKK